MPLILLLLMLAPSSPCSQTPHHQARRNAAEPNRTLFVAGFDPRGIRTRDVEKAFEEFGRLVVSEPVFLACFEPSQYCVACCLGG